MKIVYLLCIFVVFTLDTTRFALASNLDEERLSSSIIETTVIQVTEVLNKNYVFPEMALEMNAYLRQQLLLGKYQESHTYRELIKQLQLDLRQVSDDGHISLLLSVDSIDRTSVELPLTESQTKIHAELIAKGTPSPLGYLQINTFGGGKTKDNIAKAMEGVAFCEVLIIDLRDNEGGDPNAVAFLSSYFVEDRTHLWSVFDRNGEEVITVRSRENKEKFSGDLYLLTSNRTYSAAEAFAYTMKHMGRALIVGETTGGGAHLVDMMQINDDIDIRIPVARAYNRITGSNWEKVGVVPHLLVNASEAKEAVIERLKNEAIKQTN